MSGALIVGVGVGNGVFAGGIGVLVGTAVTTLVTKGAVAAATVAVGKVTGSGWMVTITYHTPITARVMLALMAARTTRCFLLL